MYWNNMVSFSNGFNALTFIESHYKLLPLCVNDLNVPICKIQNHCILSFLIRKWMEFLQHDVSRQTCFHLKMYHHLKSPIWKSRKKSNNFNDTFTIRWPLLHLTLEYSQLQWVSRSHRHHLNLHLVTTFHGTLSSLSKLQLNKSFKCTSVCHVKCRKFGCNCCHKFPSSSLMNLFLKITY